MGQIRLSVITPSCGRSTWENTIASIKHQLGSEDELIAVGSRRPENLGDQDKFIYRANKGCRPDNSTLSGPKNETHGPRGTESGAIERDLGDAVAIGTHLLHCDDDDVFVRTAFDDIRAAICLHPRQVLIFRMEYGIKDQWFSPYSVDLNDIPTLGVQEHVGMAYFGGMMMCFPRVSPNPKWEQEGEMLNTCEDFFITKRYLAELGTEAVWPGKVIGIVRPTREQVLLHTGRISDPLYAPQPAWSGTQQPRRTFKPLNPIIEAAKALRRSKRKAP